MNPQPPPNAGRGRGQNGRGDPRGGRGSYRGNFRGGRGQGDRGWQNQRAANNGQGPSTLRGRGGFGPGQQLRGGHNGNYRVPRPAPANYPWLTTVPAANRAALLQAIQAIVPSRAGLVAHTNYRKLFHDLGATRADIERARRCKTCGINVVTAETQTQCSDGQNGRHTINTFAEQAGNNRFFAPAVNPSVPKRPFVVVDGEFLNAWKTSSDADGYETIVGRFAAIDGLTGEVLINNFVKPAAPARLQNYNTRYSGIDPRDVNAAQRRGEVIMGLARMHEELGRYVDESTIFAGHATYNDLTKSKFSHPRILDTQLLYQYVNGNRYPGLASLANDLLGIVIQQGTHDALEDACATRELCLLRAGYAGGSGGQQTLCPPQAPVPAQVNASAQAGGVSQTATQNNTAPSTTAMGAMNVSGPVTTNVTAPDSDW